MATILYVQPEIKFCSPPGHFHHEPPLLYTLELPTVTGGKCLACLPLGKHNTAYNSDNDLI